MVLLVSSSPGKMEELLGKFGVDRLALNVLGDTEVDNFLLFVGGSRLHGQANKTADIDMSGIYVPPAHELTSFDIQNKVHTTKFEIPSETGRVMLPVSVTLLPLQRAMQQAYDLEGNVWKNMSLIARSASDWLVHEPINRDGGYNLLHLMEDTTARMVPHLPKYAFEPFYYGIARSYREQIKKELKSNDPTKLIKFVARFHHALAMWRDSRIQWPIGMYDWNDLRNMDHAVPPDSFTRLQHAMTKDRADLWRDVADEFDSVNDPKLKPDEADVERFRHHFKKMVGPAMRRLYKL